jgi:four helix bundle protein
VDLQGWAQAVPDLIKSDRLWELEAYRLALFACDVAWKDVVQLNSDHRTRSLADQLYRAIGSVSANIAEGFSRGTGRDRALFYQYALGSAREGRDRYYKGRHVLGSEVAELRMELLTSIIRLLLTMIPDQRGR